MPTAQPEQDPQRAFVSLLTQHQGSLRAFIISMMPGQSGVEDVLQETNLTLWEKRDRFEIGTNFTAWSFAIARFSVLEHRRKLRRDGRIIFSDELLDKLAPPEEVLQPESLQARHDALEACLGKLSPDQREMIDRRYKKGTSLEDYSAEIGKTANSVRVALFRVRNGLRRCIQRELQLSDPAS